jgi:hypothetical protein
MQYRRRYEIVTREANRYNGLINQNEVAQCVELRMKST